MSERAFGRQEGAFKLDLPPPEEPGLLMTSMIDVIFILLAFFVCVSEIKKGKLTVDVPDVAAAEASEQPGETVDPLVIEVTSGDEIYVEGKKMENGEQLLDTLRAVAKAREVSPDSVPLHISGDKRATLGAMMAIAGRASQAGFRKFEYAVDVGGK